MNTNTPDGYEVTGLTFDASGRAWPQLERIDPSQKHRVYSCAPCEGEWDGNGCRVLTADDVEIGIVRRVEFDRDADSGMATVEVYFKDCNGRFLIDYLENNPCIATIRTWCKVVPIRANSEPILAQSNQG